LNHFSLLPLFCTLQHYFIAMKQKTTFLATFLSFLLSMAGWAQQENDIKLLRMSVNEESRNFKKHDITVNGDIREIVIDSLNGQAYLSVQMIKGRKLKKEGFIASFDLEAEKALWKKDFKYDNSHNDINLELSHESAPFVVMKYNAFGLDAEIGVQSWAINSDDFRIHPNGKFFFANEVSKLMTLYSTESGKPIWQYTMEFGDTQNVNFTSDSCMIVLEKGIHHVNLSDGSTWYKKIKGLKSYNPMSQAGRAGVVAGSTAMFGLIGGLIAAAATSSSSTASIVGSKTSNYLFEEDDIYIAAEYLAKYSHTGRLLWKDEDLSKKRGVSSIISLGAEDFLLVDFGYRYNSDGYKVRSGDASCEFISKKTGELQRGIVMPTEGDDFLKDFVLEEQTISFLGKRTLFTIGLESLETINSKEFGGTYTNIGLSKFVDPNDYKMVEDQFVLLSSISDGSLLIRNTADKVVEFNVNLEPVKVYSADEFYELKDEYLDFKLICNSRECLLIDENNVKSSELSLSENALLMNGFLVDYDSDKATLVKLN